MLKTEILFLYVIVVAGINFKRCPNPFELGCVFWLDPELQIEVFPAIATR